jgi:hypothetical protein
VLQRVAISRTPLSLQDGRRSRALVTIVHPAGPTTCRSFTSAGRELASNDRSFEQDSFGPEHASPSASEVRQIGCAAADSTRRWN